MTAGNPDAGTEPRSAELRSGSKEKPGDDYPDLDDPGYIRHCVFPCCKAEYHAIRGSADERRWYMGNSGPIHGKYICPDHIATVREHQPAWITAEEPITGTRCMCGWRWMPEERSPAGVHLEAWRFHVRDALAGKIEGSDVEQFGSSAGSPARSVKPGHASSH